MTTDEEKIMALLKNATWQEPVSFDTLVETMKATLTAVGVQLVLDSLYGSAKINRCKVTRNDCTHLMFWPTGIITKSNFRQYQAPDTAPIRDVKPLTKKEQSMKPVTGKARIMLELLIKQGSATAKELCIAADTSAVKPFLPSYFERGLLRSEKTENGTIYRLAPGVIPEELLREKHVAPVDLGQPIPEPEENRESMAVNDPETRSEPVRILYNPLLDPRKLSKDMHAANGMFAEAERRFRLARTSDETLLLFGLGADPIELNQAQTQLLISFVTAWQGNEAGA